VENFERKKFFSPSQKAVEVNNLILKFKNIFNKKNTRERKVVFFF